MVATLSFPRQNHRRRSPVTADSAPARRDEAHGVRQGKKSRPIATVADRDRVRRLLDRPIEFMPNEAFAGAGHEAALRESLEVASRLLSTPTAASKSSRRVESFLQRLDEIPLLTQVQEVHLFRSMNYLKFRADTARDQLDREWPQREVIEEIEASLAQADRIRNYIIRANLRLVVSVTKQYSDPWNSLPELVSDGNVSLMRAVEKFDVARGFRFSTYATWAIRKNFNRSIGKQRLDRARFVAGDELVSQVATSERSAQTTQLVLGRLREALGDILARLEDRERMIVTARFGLDEAGHPHTLQEVADDLGICKERVRQLQARAMLKLQAFADEANMEPPAA